MSGYGTTQKGTDGIYLSSVQPPNAPGANPVPLQGGPITTDSAGNTSAPASVVLNSGTYVQGSPDGGTTLKIIKTASDGTLVNNATLQAGTAFAGYMGTYREMVSLGLIASAKYLTATQALVNNGGAAAAAMSFTDQNGNAYSTVTNGKTLYIAYIDVSLDAGGTIYAPLTQTATITITDGTNTKYKYIAQTGGPGRELALFPTIASTLSLTVKASTSNLAVAVGNVICSLLCWEV